LTEIGRYYGAIDEFVIEAGRFQRVFPSFFRVMKLLPLPPAGAIIGATTKGGAA
jgi:hypothetical protein